MPDLDQIKQGEQGARDRRGRFARGGPAIPPAEWPRWLSRPRAVPKGVVLSSLFIAGCGCEDPQRRRIDGCYSL